MSFLLIFRPHGTVGDTVPGAGQHLQLRHRQCSKGGGPDRGGDVGGVLHHPRVRGPGRVRPHPQDHPGREEEGCQGSSTSLNQKQMTFAAMNNLKRLSAA